MLSKKFGKFCKLSGLACKTKSVSFVVVHVAVIVNPCFNVQA